jgi:hypothetical protein
MCRSIKVLRGNEPTDQDVRAAALQFVRKVSGYQQPPPAEAAAFAEAVDAVSDAAGRLLRALA